MSIKIFNDVIDVAVVGITNSGKSTFIASMIDQQKFGNSLTKLHQNDGGLTKVTTFYELSDCDNPSVSEVKFDLDNLTLNIDSKDVVGMNAKLHNMDYKGFKINPVTASEDGSFKKSLEDNLKIVSDKIKNDLNYAISMINSSKADKLVSYIKIKVPASKKALEIMRKYGFKTVILRDTRGFLDLELSESSKKPPSLVEAGLDGIQACIFMNGTNLTMPSLGREMYGEFVKSIFEAVPTFIIERSAILGSKLEDCMNDEINISSDIYNDLVKNKSVIKLNFKEIHKFLKSLSIIDENGEATNQLIKTHKRELLLPEVGVLTDDEINYDEEEYQRYEFCSLEVFDRLLSSLSDFRTLLNNIILYFDDQNKVNDVHVEFFNVFYKKLFTRIVKEYCAYEKHSNYIVRPVTEGYSKDKLLNDLVHGSLLGKRDGITTPAVDRPYEYGATGVFSVTAWKAINMLILDLSESEEIIGSIKKHVENPEDNGILNKYILEIQQCLKYVLQNSFTDVRANFAGYPIVDRFIVVNAIENAKNKWKTEYSLKFGKEAIDNVFIIKVKEELDRISISDYVRFSQLYQFFYNTIDQYFGYVSTNHNYVETENKHHYSMT